jgi:hypothetical protein
LIAARFTGVHGCSIAICTCMLAAGYCLSARHQQCSLSNQQLGHITTHIEKKLILAAHVGECRYTCFMLCCCCCSLAALADLAGARAEIGRQTASDERQCRFGGAYQRAACSPRACCGLHVCSGCRSNAHHTYWAQCKY